MIIPECYRDKYWLGPGDPWASAPDASSNSASKASRRPKKAAAKHKAAPTKGRKPAGRATRSKKAVVSDSESEEPEEPEAKDEIKIDGKPKMYTTFPVVLTTYEIVMRDRIYLEQYRWGFVVVDEGHRLKNFECRLVRELKALPATGRMVLTGTPLQVCRVLFVRLRDNHRCSEQPRRALVTPQLRAARRLHRPRYLPGMV